MYCKKCGSQLGKHDVFCRVCGEVLNEEADQMTQRSLCEKMEGVSCSEKGNRPEEEFVWDVYDFPHPKKTEEIDFDWDVDQRNAEEFGESEEEKNFWAELKKISEQTSKNERNVERQNDLLEEELFRDMSRPMENQASVGKREHFFTFTKKNEEFQKLLDQEFEKIRGKNPVRPPMRLAAEEEEALRGICRDTMPISLGDLKKAEEALEKEEPFIAETAFAIKRETESTERSFDGTAEMKPDEAAEFEGQAEALEKPDPNFDSDLAKLSLEELKKLEAMIAENMADGTAEKPDGSLFISKFLPEKAEEKIEPEKPSETEVETSSEIEPAEAVSEEEAPSLSMQDTASNSEPEVITVDAFEESTEAASGEKHILRWILIGILGAVLVFELVIFGIQKLCPDSAAGRMIWNTQQTIVSAICGDEASKSKEAIPEETGETKPEDTEAAPAAAEEKIVESLLDRNKNIGTVRYSDVLKFKEEADYGVEGINASAALENEFMTAPDGQQINIKEQAIGTVIAYDSAWVDYVNSGDTGVFGLVAEESAAEAALKSYAPTGGTTQFSLLEVGDVRQGSNGFYVWAHETVSTEKDGTVQTQEKNCIYFLRAAGGEMKIAAYINY